MTHDNQQKEEEEGVDFGGHCNAALLWWGLRATLGTCRGEDRAIMWPILLTGAPV